MPFNKDSLLLYAVTDRAWVGRQTLLEQIEDALNGGVTMIQLREKQLSEEEFLREAVQVRALCRRYGVPLIINDHLAVALASGADGVHVGAEDMPVQEIRQRVPKDFIIGATAKTVQQARLAEAGGADYLGVGAVFPSPTKRDAVRITTEQLRAISGAVSIPVVAIGGIDADNVMVLRGADLAGIAVVSALFAAEDIRTAALELKTAAQTLRQKEDCR